MIHRVLLAGMLAGLSCSFASARQLGSPFTIRSSPTITSSVCDVGYDLTRDTYLLVFQRADGTIRGRPYPAEDGVARNLGGGCGNARTARPLSCSLDPAVGLRLVAQWITIGGAATPCPTFPSLAASDRLELTLGR